jgi:hypothetical protein
LDLSRPFVSGMSDLYYGNPARHSADAGCGAARVNGKMYLCSDTQKHSAVQSWPRSSALMRVVVKSRVQYPCETRNLSNWQNTSLSSQPCYNLPHIYQEGSSKITRNTLTGIMAGAQLCDVCSSIPLDLFLPMHTCGHGHYHNGKAWRFAVEHFGGVNCLQELRSSSARGCPMCNLINMALESAEPSWATGKFKGRGHSALLTGAPARGGPRFPEPGIYLEVIQEGELLVYDSNRRAGLYWELKQLNYGQSQCKSRSSLVLIQ